MNCARCEKWLAAGDDLAAWKRRRVEWHLAECPGCRELAAGLAEVRAELRALAAEPVAADDCAWIRERVMQRVASEPRPVGSGRQWILVPAVAAAALTFAIVWPNLHPPPVPSPAVARIAPQPADLAFAKPPVPAVAHRAPHNRAAAVRERMPEPAVRAILPSRPDQPVLVRFETKDPKVVIYWVFEEKKGD